MDANLILAVDSSQAKAGTAELDRLTVASGKAERAAMGLSAGTVRAADSEARLAASANAAQAAVTRTGTAFAGATSHVGQLGFQLTDIGMMLASGQNPLMTMVQQGGQAAAVFGQAGVSSVGGALGLLKNSFLSLINPISLATYAVIGLGGAAVQWLSHLGGDLEPLEDMLEHHADLIDRIADAYDDAAKGVTGYGTESAQVLSVMLQGQTVALTDKMEDLREQLTAGALGFGGFDPSTIAPFTDALRQLEGAADGTEVSVTALVEQVAALVAADPSPEMLRAANAFFAITKDAYDAEQQLRGTAKAIADAARIAGGGVQALEDYGDAMERLAGIALPNLSDRAQAAADYADAIDNAATAYDRLAATTAYRDALARISADEAADRQKDLDRLARSSGNQIQGVIDGLHEEATALGLTGQALAEYNALTSAGIDRNSSMADEVLAAADALYALEAAQDAADEAAKRWEKAQDATLNFVQDIAGNLRQGETLWRSWADAALDALGRIADKLLNVGIDRLFGALAGGLGGGAGGGGGGIGHGAILRMLFGGNFADGGFLPAGQWGNVGERGPERILATPRGAMVVPSSNSGGGRSGPVEVIVRVIPMPGPLFNATVDARSTSAAVKVYTQADKAKTRRGETHG